MALIHEFQLISTKDKSIIDRIEICDDLICYILDSLNWIPTKKTNAKQQQDILVLKYP